MRQPYRSTASKVWECEIMNCSKASPKFVSKIGKWHLLIFSYIWQIYIYNQNVRYDNLFRKLSGNGNSKERWRFWSTNGNENETISSHQAFLTTGDVISVIQMHLCSLSLIKISPYLISKVVWCLRSRKKELWLGKCIEFCWNQTIKKLQ